MTLNSAEFFVIFFSFIPLYFLFKKYNWVILLLFNYYFYLNLIPQYITLIFCTSLASYASAIVLGKLRNVRAKKLCLVFSIILVLLPLAYLKYCDFIGSIFLPNFKAKNLIAPVGISFYTLGIVSYLVDVYKKKYEPYTHLGYYLCYVSFFGTILSGPIERANSFIPQLSKKVKFDEDRIFLGLKYISWGLFLKMVVADNLGIFVDKIYGTPDNLGIFSDKIGSPENFQGIPLIIATIFYGIQLYADFNGYSHLALGFSKIIGIDIIENFRYPYFRQGVIDFWRGWHISLSSWLRDYIYFPLGGSRKGKIRTFFNRMAVFLVSGLWHGASWNFVIWGGLHGIYQSIEGMFRKKSPSDRTLKKNFLSILLTFILVDFAWIFFRAVNLNSAIYIVTHLFSNLSMEGFNVIFTMIVNKRIFLMLILLILFTFIVDYYKYTEKKFSTKVKSFFYITLWIMILFLSQNISSSFIYFKF